ncbi:hypothetical protein LCGC14_0737670 [marine sediment metagenome]|uniref:Uncharacterized protein n=1 Tax=marine sediment metagenome TaxID=412755 RepID=A0A0F9SSI2_9ZZZZ
MKLIIKEIIFPIILFVIFFVSFIVAIIFIPKAVIDYGDNDWWTEVFCVKENGKYQENFYYDVCIIDGIEYLSEFVKTDEYYNVTDYGRKSKWKLVRKK